MQALAASGMSHVVITVLGSINTVIAGVQTYLKGQGLPNRVQQYGFGLRKLREHIEDLERHFAQPGCKLDIDHEISTQPDTMLTYLGYRRFLVSDLKYIFPLSEDRSKTNYKKNVK